MLPRAVVSTLALHATDKPCVCVSWTAATHIHTHACPRELTHTHTCIQRHSHVSLHRHAELHLYPHYLQIGVHNFMCRHLRTCGAPASIITTEPSLVDFIFLFNFKQTAEVGIVGIPLETDGGWVSGEGWWRWVDGWRHVTEHDMFLPPNHLDIFTIYLPLVRLHGVARH